MVPPSANLNLDITAISGICGSISIACWVVVFSPQIVENFRRGSADGLSLQFIIVWLLGDVFNILGAVLQGVLPTMLILAIYYTIADIVLLGQCFYYRGFTWKDEVMPPKQNGSTNSNGTESEDPNRHVGEPNERTGLLGPNPFERERRGSGVSIGHLSPLVPLIDPPKPNDTPVRKIKHSRFQTTVFNLITILTVCAAGVLGWYITGRSKTRTHQTPEKGVGGGSDVHFNLWGQIFGYICAVLYLGSRIPQLVLNFRRKSTEGVSMLFFLFACIGNLTYVLSIFAYESKCEGKHGKCRDGEMWNLYWRYILVNASWLAGSAGTLLLDLGIFAQFFIYREKNEGESAVVENGNGRPVSND